MRILLVNYRYFISGGPEKYMFNIKKMLEDNGHEVIPFSIKHERTITDDLVDKWREALATPVARKRIKDGKRSIKPWLDFSHHPQRHSNL